MPALLAIGLAAACSAGSSSGGPYGVVGAVLALAGLAWILRGDERGPRAPAASPAADDGGHPGGPPAQAGTSRGPSGRQPRASVSGEVMPDVAPVRRPDAHDVAHREHADELAALDDDQVADVAPRHLDRGPLEAPVGSRGDHRVAAVVADPLGVGVLARGRAS